MYNTSIPLWTVCHLPRSSRNGACLPLFWSCEAKKLSASTS